MTLPFLHSQILNGVLDFQQGGFILKILNGSIILRLFRQSILFLGSYALSFSSKPILN